MIKMRIMIMVMINMIIMMKKKKQRIMKAVIIETLIGIDEESISIQIIT